MMGVAHCERFAPDALLDELPRQLPLMGYFTGVAHEPWGVWRAPRAHPERATTAAVLNPTTPPDTAQVQAVVDHLRWRHDPGAAVLLVSAKASLALWFTASILVKFIDFDIVAPILLTPAAIVVAIVVARHHSPASLDPDVARHVSECRAYSRRVTVAQDFTKRMLMTPDETTWSDTWKSASTTSCATPDPRDPE